MGVRLSDTDLPDRRIACRHSRDHVESAGTIPLYERGIRINLYQFLQHGLQLFFIGLVIGMERNVLPLVSHDYGVPKGSFLFLMSFIVSFGLVKGVLNFVAGHLSECLGRKRVLLLGWVAALPIPFLLRFGDNWYWVVVANLFLGINQGLAWTMAVTSNVDLSRANQRGFAAGFNEFAGYLAVGLGGLLIGYATQMVGMRLALFWLSLIIIVLAGWLGAVFLRDTLPWAHAEHRESEADENDGQAGHFATGLPAQASAKAVFFFVSFGHPGFNAFCQAGVINKVADALLWVFLPLLLNAQGLDTIRIGWISAVYGLTWGVCQLFVGALSDLVGRRNMIIAGQWLLAVGILLVSVCRDTFWLLVIAALLGLGMALVYANLIAAVADISRPAWRSLALGTYRFWRDIGYAIGGGVLGMVAQFSMRLEPAFWLAAGLLLLSGWIVALRAVETRPRFDRI